MSYMDKEVQRKARLAEIAAGRALISGTLSANQVKFEIGMYIRPTIKVTLNDGAVVILELKAIKLGEPSNEGHSGSEEQPEDAEGSSGERTTA